MLNNLLKSLLSYLTAFFTGYYKAKLGNQQKAIKQVEKGNKASISAYNPDDRERLRKKYN